MLTMSANREDGDSSSSAGCSSPEQRSESRGSSVSAGLREEYEDLLKYAVVAPKLLDGSSSLPKLPPTVTTEHRCELESTDTAASPPGRFREETY